MKKTAPIMAFAGILVLCVLGAAYAAYPSIASGYAVDSNYHGINVPPGSEVIVTAYTTDDTITQVTFLWKNPSDNTVWTEVDASRTTEAEQYDGQTVYSFTGPSHSPDDYGDWGVQALFQGLDGKTKEGVELVVSIKATSFFHVPEPAAIAAAATSIAAFGLYAAYRKRKL